MGASRLLLVSKYALYPAHWQALRLIRERYAVEAVVIGEARLALDAVHEAVGWVDPVAEADGPELHLFPNVPLEEKLGWLRRKLPGLAPDAIWLQEEPHDLVALEVLRAFFFHRPRPRIVCALNENLFPPVSRRFWLRRRLLWTRIDYLLASATVAIDGARAAGMPRVPAEPLVAGYHEPPPEVEPRALPFERGPGDFVCAFVGRIVEEKGWKVLLEALRLLPSEVKCVLAGAGAQEEELRATLADGKLAGRAAYLGLVPKVELWSIYAAVDCIVMPSLTTTGWMEQFGGILSDAMASRRPSIASDSGSMPEVLGPAGLVVPEGDAAALALAIERLRRDPELRRRLGEEGRRRFEREFAIPVYADKIARALELDPRQ